MEIAITTQEVEGKGWIAFAPEVRATAQGETEDEAKRNLLALFERYPDLFDQVRSARRRHVSVELVPA